MDNLDTTQTPEKISLGGSPPPPSDAVASTRAAKADIGLSQTTGMKYDDVYKQISEGNEGSYRQNAASTLDLKDIDTKQQQLKDLAVSKGRNLSLDEVRNFLNPPSKIPETLSRWGVNNNPDTVIEKAYSEKYLDSLNRWGMLNPDSPLAKAQAENPEDVSKMSQNASDVLSRREYMLKRVQDIQDDVDKDAWFKVPFVKTPLTPEGDIEVGSRAAPWSSALNWATLGIYGGLREEYLMRGNTPDTSRLSGILEGSNIRDQAQEILTSPDWKDKFDRGFERLKAQDPTSAQQWAASMIGMSVEDLVLRNSMSALNIAGGVGVAKTVKVGLEAAGKASVAAIGKGRVPLTPVAQTDATLAVQKTIEDILKTSPASPTKAAVAESLGDVHEAAVQKTIVSNMHPDPTKDAVDTLFDMHRVNQEKIKSDPGNLSREEHARMLEAGEGFEKRATDTIINTTKVVRLPELAENGFRDIADRVKEYFRGRENTIANVEIIHDPIANTEHHVVTLTNYDGQPFISEQQALNHAAINKYEGVHVVGKDPDVVYLPRAALLKEKLYGEPTRGPGGKFSGYRPVSADNPRFEINPEFEHETKEGEHRFYNVPGRTSKLPGSVEDRYEILPRVNPEPTDIPFNLKTGKFGQPLPYGPQIVPKGVGYHIRWSIPLDETQDFVRDAQIGPRTKSASSSDRSRFNRIANGILGYFRLPQDTLSPAEVENRAKVVHAQSNYIDLLQKEYRYIEDIFHGKLEPGTQRKVLSYVGNLTSKNKQVWNDFVRSLIVSQKLPDPVTKLPGYYMKTPAEIQHFWQTNFGRPVSFAEQQAYLAAGRLDMADFIFRNMAVKRNMDRLGVMEHTLTNTVNGETKDFAKFNGRFIKKIPEGADRTVLVHDGEGNTRFYNSMNSEEKKHYREMFKEGKYQGAQLYAPDRYPIKVLDKNGEHVRVEYVISKSMTSKNTDYNQVGYRGGGHWDYSYERWVKQPIMRKQTIGGRTSWVYSGDATFAPVKSNVDGKFFAEKLSQIRKLLRDKKVAEAKALHLSYSDQPWKDFVRHFYPRKNRETGEIEPSRFNLHEDFHVVPSGMTVMEHNKDLINKYNRLPGTFVDATRQHSLERNFQVEYTGARDSHDLFEPKNVGTIGNPMYKFQPAELTDPIVSMTRASNRIVNSLYMDDYKISAIEHWLQENMHMLDGDPKQIMASPFYSFLNEKIRRGAGLQGEIARSNRYKIQKLIGMPTYVDSLIHMVKQDLADAMFETDSKIMKAALITPNWLLHKVSSPTNLVRALAFHENLGLFNWMQLAAQSMGWINVAALSPTHAPSAMFASWMHIWSRVNMSDKFLGHLDKMAGTFGWKPGEWQEAMRAYENSGFHRLGNSLVIGNGAAKQNFLLSEGKRLVRNGTIFFDLAEQNIRHGAWYAAYHEFKRAYPNQKIGDVEIGKILRRANDMYANMGRDSKTLLNTGLTSMTLQFFKYIENVGQLFLSKRIGDVFGKENTWQTRAQQRASMILMYSLAFGPVGTTGLSMLPTSDWIRKSQLAQGYVPGQNKLSTLLMEGPLSMAGAYASGWWRTGQMDMSKGTFYNYNNRYGVNGYQLIRDLLEPNPVFWKIIMGASGSSLANAFQSATPFVQAITSSFNDEQDAPFRLTINDWKEGLRNVNSFRYGERLVYALEFGKWIDRHGRNVQDIGTVDAIFRSLLGTNDQKIDDAYLKQLIRNEEKDGYSAAEKEYQNYRRLAEQSAMNNDPEQAKVYNKNAIFALKSAGVPPQIAAKIFRHDAEMNKNTLDKTNWSFYKQDVPIYRQDNASEAYRNTYQEQQVNK